MKKLVSFFLEKYVKYVSCQGNASFGTKLNLCLRHRAISQTVFCYDVLNNEF